MVMMGGRRDLPRQADAPYLTHFCSSLNCGSATFFLPKKGANGKKISIKMHGKLHFWEPKEG
jgi:hypothetical protein